MPRVRLIHWNESEAIERAGRLRAMGFVVNAEPLQTTGAMKSLRDDPPEAFVIDLSRLPSHGRTIGFTLREQKPTRMIPIVFVDGEAEKVAATRKLLPDAAYTTWAKIARDLPRAIANPPKNPFVAKSESGPSGGAGYSGTPLPKKLGIKEGAIVGLIGAPKDFEQTLGKLPAGAKVVRQPRKPCDVVLCFAVMKKELTPRMKTAMRISADSGLWLIWPKKSSGVASDLSEEVVRTMGLAAGWVDFKVCALDDTWSGLAFKRKKGV